MALFLLVIIIAVALGIIGAVAHGLLFLLVIGTVLLVADVAFFGTRLTRRGRAQR
ncbi:hypothetical protein P3T37_006075 [Kitasatospora sp. MAA4]|uniref:hypothetical protein n=1 Tax=Kitasatospora sp. MAA4 TaxID=3035093 RepID=UPI002475C0F8|nr:hypothetical protein [Kitasatospora sp. MAA4]MDH6136644.1 hypothetical protein [Kitasatospora sp. MAA4]